MSRRLLRSSLVAAGLLVWVLASGCSNAAHDACARPDAAASTQQCESSRADDEQVESAQIPNGKGILIGEVENARDLGGTPLADGSVAFDTLFRGPPLSQLSAAGCAELSGRGLRTIVDLRIESERVAEPETPCALEQASVVLAPLPVPYEVSPENYVADLNSRESIGQVFRTLADDNAYPVYIHCTWGRDRTGVVAALILTALGASRPDIMQEYLLSRRTVGAYPHSLEAMLDELERQGGIEAYLDAAGIDETQRATLRAHAVALSEPASDGG